MKQILYILIAVSVFSCGVDCETGYIERVSNVGLPKNIEIIECNDNGVTLVATVFHTDSVGIEKLLRENEFEKVPADYSPRFFGMSLLDSANLNFGNKENLFLLEDCIETNSWYFLLNEKRGIVWCEVQYPDWAGDNPPCDKTEN